MKVLITLFSLLALAGCSEIGDLPERPKIPQTRISTREIPNSDLDEELYIGDITFWRLYWYWDF